MKLIKLTKGKFTKVDEEDFEELNKYKWCFDDQYALSGKVGLMHRFIMKAKKGQFLDHINRDKLDNRKVNLRFVTVQQNKWNLNKHPKNKSGHSLIYRNNYKEPKGGFVGSWRVHITFNGKTFYDKAFHTIEEALVNRNLILTKIRGTYANLD